MKRKNWKNYPKRKKIPHARDGSLKCIIDEFGEKRYYCIECKKYYPIEEMKTFKKEENGHQVKHAGSYCRECDRILARKRTREKYQTEKNTFGSRVKTGRVVGRKPMQPMRFPPMDAEIPLWYRGMGYK